MEPETASINYHNNPDVKLRFPFKMATPSDVIETILDHGPGAELIVLKADLGDAYKNLPVTPSVFHKQTICLAGVYFVDSRLLFGVTYLF